MKLALSLALAPSIALVLLTGCERAAPAPAPAPSPQPGRGSASDGGRDCSNATDRDRDQDGHPVQECGGDDCDDTDAFRFPGAGRERCGGTLANGVAALDHDEDCNPCTISGSTLGFDNSPDGDDDHDDYPAASCTNPWLLSTGPTGCDLRQVILVDKGKRVRGLDCDDASVATQPGRQVCADSTHLALCTPAGRFSKLPTSSTKPATKKDAWPTIDEATGIATIACPTGTTCQSQPDGTGACH